MKPRFAISDSERLVCRRNKGGWRGTVTAEDADDSVETALAALTGALFLLTLSWHDWLEPLGIAPDNHSGTVEWLVVAGLFVLFVAFAVSARLEWRRRALAQ